MWLAPIGRLAGSGKPLQFTQGVAKLCEFVLIEPHHLVHAAVIGVGACDPQPARACGTPQRAKSGPGGAGRGGGRDLGDCLVVGCLKVGHKVACREGEDTFGMACETPRLFVDKNAKRDQSVKVGLEGCRNTRENARDLLDCRGFDGTHHLDDLGANRDDELLPDLGRYAACVVGGGVVSGHAQRR